VVAEAGFEQTETGLVAAGDGWFVLNARDARWFHHEGRGARVIFEGEVDFAQVGISVYALEPGEPMGMHHWEADQEDFLALAGEALLIIEGEDRPLRRWDFVHCPPDTKHIIVGAGEGPCVVLAVGAREHQGTQAGAGTPSTRSRCGIEPVSSGRRPTVKRRTRPCQGASQRATRRTGWLSS
jgi:uncharacterized cupin superfamily protein